MSLATSTQPLVSDVLVSKTHRLFLLVMVVGAIICAAASYQAGKPMYVPEYFSMLTAMFIGICGKNATDNYVNFSYNTRQVGYQSGPLPPAPVSQS